MKEKIVLPTKEQLLIAMKLSETSVEGANYLVERFKKILIGAKMLDKSDDLMNKVQEFADMVKFKLTSVTDAWSGKLKDTTDFKTMQENMADSLVTQVKVLLQGELKLDVAINDLAQLVRGFSADGKAVEPKLLEQLDKLYTSWLAENNIVSKSSTLYQSDENGVIKKDANGKEAKADAEYIRQLIDDPEKGFAKFLKDRDLKITVQQHKYPDAKSDAEKRADLESAIKASTDVKEGMANDEGVTPKADEPSSGIRSGV